MVERAAERDTQGRDGVGLYLDSIAQEALLNAETEVELAKAIEAGLLAERVQAARAADDLPFYLDCLQDEINEPKAHMSAAEHRKIKENAKDIRQVVGSLALSQELDDDELGWLVEEGQKAKERFITANLRLVVSTARKYTRSGVPLVDIIQMGNEGLMRGVEKFDFTRGYKFSTYSLWWIRQAIIREIPEHSRTIRVPVHTMEEIKLMEKAEKSLQQTLGRQPTPHELATALDKDVSRVFNLIKWRRDAISFDAPVGEDGDTTLIDLLEDKSAPITGLTTDNQTRLEQLQVLTTHLSDRDADIVKMLYGLTDGRHYKLADVGRKHGVSAERVRQIERDAIQRLRGLAEAGVIVPRSSTPEATLEQEKLARANNRAQRFMKRMVGEDSVPVDITQVQAEEFLEKLIKLYPKLGIRKSNIHPQREQFRVMRLHVKGLSDAKVASKLRGKITPEIASTRRSIFLRQLQTKGPSQEELRAILNGIVPNSSVGENILTQPADLLEEATVKVEQDEQEPIKQPTQIVESVTPEIAAPKRRANPLDVARVIAQRRMLVNSRLNPA